MLAQVNRRAPVFHLPTHHLSFLISLCIFKNHPHFSNEEPEAGTSWKGPVIRSPPFSASLPADRPPQRAPRTALCSGSQETPPALQGFAELRLRLGWTIDTCRAEVGRGGAGWGEARVTIPKLWVASARAVQRAQDGIERAAPGVTQSRMQHDLDGPPDHNPRLTAGSEPGKAPCPGRRRAASVP